MADIDAILPSHSLDAEKAVLGTFFLNDSAVDQTQSILSVSDFYDPRHQEIYRCILKMVGEGLPIDPMILIYEFERKGILEKVGGAVYITGLEQSVISPGNVRHHAKIVRDCSFRRRASNALLKLSEHAASDISEPQEIAARAATLVDGFAKGLSFTTVLSSEESATIAYDHLISEDENKGFGIPTGLRKLDWLLHGLQPGGLYIIAARTSVGKTSLAMQIGLNAHNNGYGVSVCSFEMDALEIMQKIEAQATKIPVEKIQYGKTSDGCKITEEEITQVADFLERFRQSNFFIYDDSMASAEEIISQCLAIKTKQPQIGLIIIDYLQLMNKKEKSENRNLELGHITSSLKKMAGKLKIPIVLLSQLSRGIEKELKPRRPRLSDLRESGAIEQDADVVIFIHRTSEQNECVVADDIELIVAKARKAKVGICNARFVKEITLFQDVDKHREPPVGNYYD